MAALLVASLLWGLATTATKFALDGFAPVTVLAVELVAGTVAVWIVLLVRGYRPPPSWPVAITLGLLEPALANLGQTVGLAHTSACNAGLIFGLESSFVVVLAALLLRERISGPLGAAAVLALLGLVTLESAGGITAPRTGDLLVLCGAVSAAGYTIVARKAELADDPLGLTAHQLLFASLLVVPAAVAGWASGVQAAPAHVALRYWIAAVLVGVAGSALTFVLYNYAIARMSAGRASIVINLIPAFAMASAIGWLHEAMTLPRLGGAALIAVSVGMFSWTELRAGPPLPRPTASVDDALPIIGAERYSDPAL